MRQASFSADYQMRAVRVRVPRLQRAAQALLGHCPRGELRFSPAMPRDSVGCGAANRWRPH